jgi:hypothetical protein
MYKLKKVFIVSLLTLLVGSILQYSRRSQRADIILVGTLRQSQARSIVSIGTLPYPYQFRNPARWDEAVSAYYLRDEFLGRIVDDPRFPHDQAGNHYWRTRWLRAHLSIRVEPVTGGSMSIGLRADPRRIDEGTAILLMVGDQIRSESDLKRPPEFQYESATGSSRQRRWTDLQSTPQEFRYEWSPRGVSVLKNAIR